MQVVAKTGEEGQEFDPRKVGRMLSTACRLAPSRFKELVQPAMKTANTLAAHDRRFFRQQIDSMIQGDCGEARFGRGEWPMPTHRFSLKNPSPYNSKCAADQSSRGNGPCFPQLQYTQHELWPTRVATTRIEIPGDPQFHKRLSDMAIKKYLDFTAHAKRQGRQRLEDINNAFFSAQDKSENPSHGRGRSFWPELYNSEVSTQATCLLCPALLAMPYPEPLPTELR